LIHTRERGTSGVKSILSGRGFFLVLIGRSERGLKKKKVLTGV